MQDAIAFHDSIARVWEAGYQRDTFAVRLNMLSSLIPRGDSDQRWLDAGCGTGTLSRWLSRERGFSVTAIDAAEQMLTNATPEPRVAYRRGDASNPEFSPGTFDGVLSSSVLEYLPSVERALRGFHRVLKPGGTLVASVPNSALSVRVPLRLVYWLTKPMGRRRWYTFLEHSKHAYSAPGFSSVLQDCGFRVERLVGFGPVDLPGGFRLPAPGTLIFALARRQ